MMSLLCHWVYTKRAAILIISDTEIENVHNTKSTEFGSLR